MDSARKVGRPRAASRELLEDAACELFLEQGFGATSVAEITSRAGVSRSTFFNYFGTKSDLLWARFDDAVARLRSDLASDGADAVAALRLLAAQLPPENVALAFSQGDVMGLGEELRLASVRRLADVSDVVAHHLVAHGSSRLAAEVRATALAGALLAAVRTWSLEGAGRCDLPTTFDEALAALEGLAPGDGVRGAAGATRH